MVTNEGFIRLKTIQVEQRRRIVGQIKTTIAMFELQINDLNREIHAEEDRTRIHDHAHFAYSTFAKASLERRDNLLRSSDKLRTQLDVANNAFREAVENLAATTKLVNGDRTPTQPQIIGDFIMQT